MAKDSAVWIEIGRSFHQLGTVQEKDCAQLINKVHAPKYFLICINIFYLPKNTVIQLNNLIKQFACVVNEARCCYCS